MQTEQNAGLTPPSPAKPTAPRRVLTEFDWVVYADATFAGLSILIPVPFVDSILEAYFRRRMPRDIARRRGRTLSPAVMREVNHQPGKGILSGCLMLPLNLIIYVLRNLYRTIVYVLSVYDASEKLSYYWHRAFLLDYMVGRGHLDNPARAADAAQAMHRVLETTQTSPMLNLAGEIIETARRQIRGLLRAIFRFVRRKQETEGVRETRAGIAARWAEFRDYLLELAERYDAAYAAVVRERELAGAAQLNRPA
jgi:hypothetical protein